MTSCRSCLQGVVAFCIRFALHTYLLAYIGSCRFRRSDPAIAGLDGLVKPAWAEMTGPQVMRDESKLHEDAVSVRFRDLGAFFVFRGWAGRVLGWSSCVVQSRSSGPSFAREVRVMQLQEKTSDSRTNGFGMFGKLDLAHWQQMVEGSGPPSTAERIAIALERLVEKLGATAVKEEEPVPLVPSIAGDRLYSVEEAAKLLRFDQQTVRRHIRQGRYGSKDESKRMWVRQSEIDHFLMARKKVHGK